MKATTLATSQNRDELTRQRGTSFPFDDFPISFGRMREEFDRLFDRMSRGFPAIADFNGSGWRWGLTVDDQPNAIVVQAEAPGFEAKDFDIRVQDGELVLRASKKVEKKGEKGQVEEYREQECYESVALPTGIDKDKVDAKYHNGVLTVTLPKTAEAKAKKIDVKDS